MTAKIAAATANMPTVHTWASRVAAKPRHATEVAATRGHVGRRAVQMKPAKTRASRLRARDSDSSDRFHIVMGNAVAKPRTAKKAMTRFQPGSTRQPTVHARTPQARAAMTAWVVRRDTEEPAALMRREVMGGRGPSQRARDNNEWWAMDE